jgi:threonine dehydrogenase-like Zn-dependent dehydrogenase
MRTVILDEPGHFRLTDTTAPAAPGSGEVLVRVLTVGICGTDLHAFEGTQPFFSYPRILGHELAVEVLETGDGVDGFKAGDKCAVNPYMTCGVCAACSRGSTNCCAKMSVIGVHTDGGMRDRILLPAKQMYKCEKLPSVLIPLVETLGVGIHAVGRVEKMPERLEFAARHYGLKRYYPSHDEARQEEASMLVFDCTGDRTSMESSIQLLQQGGKLIFVGLINDKISLFDPDLHRREATILASRNSTPAEHHRVLDLMESGQIDVSAWPMDCPGPESMGGRFPAWLHREAGVVKAVVNWEI